MNTTFWEIVETPQGICLSLSVKLGWMLPILFQFSHFQEIDYGSIIKKSNIHHLFASTVTSLLWRIEVSNLSGGLKFEGDLPCRRCFCLWHLVCDVFSCQACISCSGIYTHTLSFSPSLKFTDTSDSQTTSTYSIHLSIVWGDPVLHKMT